MFFFLFASFSTSEFVDSRQIRGKIEAEWNETPILAECASFLQDIDHRIYWDFLDQISTIKSKVVTIEDAISVMKDFLDPEQINILNISLQIRYYSPRIASYRKLAESMKSHVRCSNAVVDDLSNLSNCESSFFDYEPVFGESESDKKYVLYADIDSNEWVSLFNTLQTKEGISFVVRCYGHSTEKMTVSGYGMQLKPFKYSMEFSVGNTGKKITTDERTVKEHESFNDVNLTVDYKDTKKRPKKARIATQLIKFVKNSADPLATLTQITENYPLFIPQLRKMKLTDDDYKMLQRSVQTVGVGSTALFVNGRKLQGVDLNPITIYESILEEYKVRVTLKRSFDLNEESLETYMNTGHKPQPYSQPVVDARSDTCLYWMNNLEKDEKYAEFSPSLIPFASDSEQFPNVAKNVANAIFILDIADQDDMQTIAILDDMIEYKFPARIGYIISPQKTNSNAKKIYYSYAHLYARYGPAVAHKFLLKVNDMRSCDEKTRKRGPIKPRFWKEAFSQIASSRSSPSFDKVTELFKPNTLESKHLQHIKTHLKRLGICSPALIVNGQFIEDKSPENYLRAFINQQLQDVREMMGKGLLTDSTEDYHDAILKYRHAMLRYNPIVERTSDDFSEMINLEKQSMQNQRTFAKWIQEIKYQFGSSFCVKNQTHWIFINTNSNVPQIQAEIDSFSNQMLNKDYCRIAVFQKNALPPKIIQKIIGIPDNKITIVFNGRVVHFDPDAFSKYDLELLQMYEAQQSSEFATKYMKMNSNSRSLGQSRTHREISDYLLYMTIVVSDLAHSGMIHSGNPSNSFEAGPTNVFSMFKSESDIHTMMILDPLSIEGQKISSLIPLLQKFSFGLIINPPMKVDKSRLDSLNAFYRFISGNSREFVFSFLNTSTTYSLIEDIPPTWKVKRESAKFDMDNVIVDNMEPGVHRCKLSLVSILVEGCEASAQGKVIPGVELILFNKQNQKVDETRVIRRNGYWQLNALPGEYRIQTNTENSFSVLLDSYSPKFTFIETKKQTLTYSNETIKDDGKIHCFFVASGALYERLERIAMLSILKNTQSPVKFWILENFVSPQYRETLKSFSEKYHFEYQFCSYKWPRWMPQETARQRLFWGYKILFLDVMFPNNLRRVIYVDSDQIIRTDLRELMTMDFKGAPYAFTPFCNNRPEMADYRFWEKGYWTNHLNGKPYHISALFAVDLTVFRDEETGDRLRKAYHDLADDKESLSNLDQDLPNLLQAQAPIFSLPQEWLWCGSWCSDETMSKAKTIDLCNNPRTKEGKLEYAKEHIPEWTKYDEEINQQEEVSLEL